MKKIIQKENPILRKKASEVPIAQVKTVKIKKVLAEMSEALAGEHDGVAIAASQIGYPLRIFVVSGKIFQVGFGKKFPQPPALRQGLRQGESATPLSQGEKIKDLVFINPKISKLSKEKAWVPEGCLSVRPLYGKTRRSKKATVTAYDENGQKFTRGASGLLAQIFQHETDHLEGILFIDHAKDISEELPR